MIFRRNRRSVALPRVKDDRLQRHRLKAKLDNFAESIGNVLGSITALEINTMIVEEITRDRMIPWEVYRDLYPISRQYLAELDIHPSLHDRYLSLRYKLELEYTLLLIEPNSDLFDRVTFDRLETDPILNHPQTDWDNIPTKLPSPISPIQTDTLLEIQKLLQDSSFLRILRHLGELKAILDRRQQILLQPDLDHNNIVLTDSIYAQTTIQLDGHITNRYTQEVLNSPQRNLLLELHRDSVKIGERQWQKLCGFVGKIIYQIGSIGK